VFLELECMMMMMVARESEEGVERDLLLFWLCRERKMG
jgi:hypothetical protein